MAQPTATSRRTDPSHAMLHRERVNVKAFGAIGDNVTDDYASIQAAIDYATSLRYGGSVYFPPGEYKVNSTIELPHGSHPRMSFIGGHNGTGYQNGQLPPAVWIGGGAITNAPVFNIVEEGNYTFQNLMVKGGHQAFKFADCANVRFDNCSVEAMVSGNPDNCAIMLINTFWFWFEHFAATAPSTSLPSVIMRGQAGSDVTSCGLIDFTACTFWLGGISYQQNVAPGLAGLLTFKNIVMESSNGQALLEVAGSYGSTWHLNGIKMTNVQQADATASAPLIHLNHATCNLDLPIIEIAYGSGDNCIVVNSGSVSNARVTGTAGSGSEPYVVDGSGNFLGSIKDKAIGFDLIGGEADVAATALTSTHGPAIRLSRAGDAYARAGIGSDGKHYWGPGGATSTGWDTNLYRLSANVLVTDDQFITKAPSASDVGLVTQGFASQTADLQEWQASNGSVLSFVDASGRHHMPVVATGSLPAAATAMNGAVIIEDAGAGDRNLIIYAGSQRFRIDGGTAF